MCYSIPSTEVLLILRYHNITTQTWQYRKHDSFQTRLRSSGFAKSRTCVRNVLEIINFKNCPTWLFFNKWAHKRTLCVWFIQPTTWHVFNFLFYSPHPTMLNLIIVTDINLQWGCLPAFSYPPCTQFKLERS